MYSTAAPEGGGSISARESSVTDPAYEGVDHPVASLEVRAVAAEHDEPLDGAAYTRLDAVELVLRAVGVLRALDQKRAAVQALGVLLEAPVAEGGIEPDVAPAVEGGVGIGMLARHPLAQRAAVEGRARLADRCDRDVLDDHVRGESAMAATG